MATKVEIANMAISHIAVGKSVSDLDTDRSNEASVINRFYDTVRQQTLRDFHWPFATKFADLALHEADPTDEWAYAYDYPTDCLFMRRIIDGGAYPPTHYNQPSFIIIQDTGVKKIYSNTVDAAAEYTIDEDDEAIYDPDFVMALSLRLAIQIAPRLTAGDSQRLVRDLYNQYNVELSRAAANAMNEQQLGAIQPETSSIQARG